MCGEFSEAMTGTSAPGSIGTRPAFAENATSPFGALADDRQRSSRPEQAGAKECKVADANIFVKEVPGCYELPYAAKLLAMSGTVDAIVCCGVLIKGDTMHFEYISDAVSRGIMNVNIATLTPVVYGVLNCLDEGQVRKRSSGEDGGHNHGEDWGKTAVEMAIMRREASGRGVGKAKELEAMGFQAAEAAEPGAADGPGVADKPGFF